ncbi:hypothetical protein U1Q18_032869 [Sarracenia purpurea var. burkii]
MKTSKQSRFRDSFRGSPGFQKQGKGGNDLNRFHVLSSEAYEECFPSLPGVISEAPKKEVRSAGKRCEPCGVTTSTDLEEIDNLESWLARYRASYDQSVFVAPAVGHDKRAKAQMPDRMALSESKQVSGVDKVKFGMEASSVEVVSAITEAVGADPVIVESGNEGLTLFPDSGDRDKLRHRSDLGVDSLEQSTIVDFSAEMKPMVEGDLPSAESEVKSGNKTHMSIVVECENDEEEEGESTKEEEESDGSDYSELEVGLEIEETKFAESLSIDEKRFRKGDLGDKSVPAPISVQGFYPVPVVNQVTFPESPVDGGGKKGPTEQAPKVQMIADGDYAGSKSAISINVCEEEGEIEVAEFAKLDFAHMVGDEVNCSVFVSNDFDRNKINDVSCHVKNEFMEESICSVSCKSVQMFKVENLRFTLTKDSIREPQPVANSQSNKDSLAYQTMTTTIETRQRPLHETPNSATKSVTPAEQRVPTRQPEQRRPPSSES